MDHDVPKYLETAVTLADEARLRAHSNPDESQALAVTAQAYAAIAAAVMKLPGRTSYMGRGL